MVPSSFPRISVGAEMSIISTDLVSAKRLSSIENKKRLFPWY